MLDEDLSESAEMRGILSSESWRRQIGGSEPHDMVYHRLVCTQPLPATSTYGAERPHTRPKL